MQTPQFPQGQRQQQAVTFGQAKLIHLALAVGVGMFAAIMLSFGGSVDAGEDPIEGPAKYMTPQILAAATVILSVLAIVLRGALSKVAEDRRADALAEIEQGLAPPEHVRGSMIGAAVIDSYGIFACVATMLTGEKANLAFAAIAMALIIWMTPNPTRSRTMLEA